MKYYTTSEFLFDVKNDDVACDLFELLGDAFTKDNNLALEWTFAQFYEQGIPGNIIGTMRSPKATGVGIYMAQKGYDLQMIVHNHPAGNAPSPSDINVLMNIYMPLNPYIEANVYCGGIYLQYFGNETELPDVIITP